jgi:hypothetical protein
MLNRKKSKNRLPLNRLKLLPNRLRKKSKKKHPLKLLLNR